MKTRSWASFISAAALLATMGLAGPALAEPTPDVPSPGASSGADTGTTTPEVTPTGPAASTVPDAPGDEPTATDSPAAPAPTQPEQTTTTAPATTEPAAPTTTPAETAQPRAGNPTSIDDFVAANPWVGTPLGDETAAANGGRKRAFSNATVYWSPVVGAWAVRGAIGNLYAANGSEAGYFGYPTGLETPSVNGGVYQNFQRGTLYWSPTTGARMVIGAIGVIYRSAGSERGYFGYPSGNEVLSVRGGTYQNFQNGTIYWSPRTGSASVIGAIGRVYRTHGAERGYFGYPTGSEVASVGGGTFQRFQRGTIYWSPRTGAHPVIGAIANFWQAAGGERGSFGFPVGPEVLSAAGGTVQDFQGGTIVWSPTTGAQTIRGAIGGYWMANNANWGRFGYPTGPEICNNAGCYQHFQRGAITWGPTTGAHDMYKLDARCTYGRVVCADKTTNKMYWVVNGQIRATFDARFGAPGYETTNGEHRIFRKEAMSWSYPFATWMPWSQYFTATGMAIHYSEGFAREGFPSWGSHGCINMNNYGQAEWLFGQTMIGDRVVVYYS